MASRCGRGGADLTPRLRSTAGKKRREQGRRDTRTRFPPGVPSLDQRPTGSRFVLSHESTRLSNFFGIEDVGRGLAGLEGSR